MAVTHADLAPGPKSSELGSKTGAVIMVLSILLGLSCFVLCLIAEATRSEVAWMATSDKAGRRYECTYSGSGSTPLLCSAVAFLGLAAAMVVAHGYLMVAVSKSPPPALVYWDPDSDPAKSLTWQAGFFFVSTWMTFAVGEILLLIGLSVESGHLKDWSTPRPSCLILREGLFSTAGVFALITVFLAAGLYITALRAQRLLLQQENVRREVAETAVLHSSRPMSPSRGIRAVANENMVVRENQNVRPLNEYLSAFSKQCSLV